MVAQTGNLYISGTMIEVSKFQRQFWGFRPCPIYYAIYHSSRDVTISGAAILLFPVVGRCRNYLGTLSLTSLLSERLELDFVTLSFWICFVILVNVTIKFCHFKKNSHMFDVMPNNFRCTDWRPDCCILYSLHI